MEKQWEKEELESGRLKRRLFRSSGLHTWNVKTEGSAGERG